MATTVKAKARLGRGLDSMIKGPAPTSDPKSPGLVAQVRIACRPESRLAMACGSLMGGVVPLCAYVIAHQEAAANPWLWILVAGALLFSATTLWEFGRLAFQNRAKAVGFAVLLEGVLIFSSTSWLAHVALAYLVLINAIATGSLLVLEDRK